MINSTGESDTEACSVNKGDILIGPSSGYLVDSIIGEGGFGKVVKCLKTATMAWVAVKMIKDDPDLIASAEQEIAILQSLRSIDPDRYAIVRWDSYFQYKSHICLEFELLGMSLYDLLDHVPALHLDSIRIVLYQLAEALGHLQQNGIIHADIKPENIMLVENSLIVKIIDFGLSCRVSEAQVGDSFGTIWYNAPEILLGLPYAGAIDVWALGCVAMHMFTGSPIYPGYSAFEMLHYITKGQGPFPKVMLDNGLNTEHFFTSSHSLKCPESYYQETGLMVEEPNFDHLISSLPLLEDLYESQDVENFADLVQSMLRLEASRRISPEAMLDHPFLINSTAAADNIQDNTDHTHTDNDQPIWAEGRVCQSLEDSLSEEGVAPQSLVSPQPLDDDDISGDSTSTEFSSVEQQMSFDAQTNSASSVMVTVDAIPEHSTPATDIRPACSEVPTKSWSRRIRGFFSRLRRTLCCGCCRSQEELS